MFNGLYFVINIFFKKKKKKKKKKKTLIKRNFEIN